MDRYHVVYPATPEDAPVLVHLSDTPFGMSLGKPVDVTEPVVATFTTLTGLQAAGWLGNIFFMAPQFVEEVKQLGERRLFECPIVARDEAGRTRDDAIVGVVTLDNVSCLDKKASVFEVSEDDPDDIVEMRSLALDESRIPEDRHLFRVAEFCTALIASHQLKERLVARGITGVKFVPPKDYHV